MNRVRLFLSLSFLLFIGIAGALTFQEEPKASPTPVLQGVVVDGDDRPVAGALVLTSPVFGAFRDLPLSARTDGEGRFRVLLKSDTPHRVRVEADGFATWIEKSIQLGEAVEIQLDKGSFIEGSVRDGETLKPVAGARVEVFRQDRGVSSLPSQPRLGILEAETDEKGYFRVEGVGRALHAVGVSARGYGTSRKTSLPPGSSVDLFLFAGSSIVGTVLGPDEKPLDGAYVQREIKSRGYFEPSGSAQPTSSDGRFSLLGVETGEHRLVVRHRDFAPAIVPNIDIEGNQEVDINVVLSRGADVLGRLIDETEQPISGRVSVESMSGEPASRLLLDLQADASDDGSFTLGRLPPGFHTLSVEAPGFAETSIDVTVGDKGEPIDLGDVLLETGLTIRGNLIDTAERVVVGARIFASSRGHLLDESGRRRVARAVSEEDGSFTLAGLSEGPYRLIIRAQGYAPGDEQPVEAGTVVTLVLEAAGSISGEVVGEERRPVEAYRVSAREKDQGLRGSGGSEEVFDRAGAFSLKELAAGSYVVEIQAPDFRPATVSDVEVVAGRNTDIGVVRMMRGGTVQGFVVDPSGMPVAGASVSPVEGSQSFREPVSRTLTDADGFFEIGGLPEGQAELVATHPNYAEGRASGLTVDSSRGPTETQIVLSYGGSVQGWVRARDGSGVSGRTVQYSPGRRGGTTEDFDPLSEAFAETGPDGHFRIEKVPVGRGEVQVISPMGGQGGLVISTMGVLKKEVEIVAGETAYVEFEIRQVLVYGQVSESGGPAPDLQLMFLASSGGGWVSTYSAYRGGTSPEAGPRLNYAVTRENGAYELLVDQPGAYRISVRRRDGSSLPGRTIEIPDTDTFALDLDFGGTTVIGKVLDERKEEPVVGAMVWAGSTDPEAVVGPTSTRTDTNGYFQLELEPGEYTLTVHAEGFGRKTKTMTLGSSTPPDVILLLPVGLSVSGRVTDELGQGVGDLLVLGTTGEERALSVSYARTLPDGSFQMEDLVPRPYNVLVLSRMGKFAFQPGVEPGEDQVLLTLQAGGVVLVQARDINGEPVAEARVAVTAINGLPAVGVGSSTDREGRAELAVPTGRLELTIAKENLEAKVNVDMAPGTNVPLEVVLQPKTAS